MASEVRRGCRECWDLLGSANSSVSGTEGWACVLSQAAHTVVQLTTLSGQVEREPVLLSSLPSQLLPHSSLIR